jgi:hypothetical protein
MLGCGADAGVLLIVAQWLVLLYGNWCWVLLISYFVMLMLTGCGEVVAGDDGERGGKKLGWSGPPW